MSSEESAESKFLNKRVKVFWGFYKKFYEGTVIEYNPKRKTCWRVQYDDGDKEWELEEDLRLLSENETSISSKISRKRKESEESGSEQEPHDIDEEKYLRKKAKTEKSPNENKSPKKRGRHAKKKIVKSRKEEREQSKEIDEENRSLENHEYQGESKNPREEKRGDSGEEKEIDLDEENSHNKGNNNMSGEQFLHQRVKVFWGAYNRYYFGFVSKFDPNKKKPCKVEYDDGDVTWEYAQDLELVFKKSPKKQEKN